MSDNNSHHGYHNSDGPGAFDAETDRPSERPKIDIPLPPRRKDAQREAGQPVSEGMDLYHKRLAERRALTRARLRAADRVRPAEVFEPERSGFKAQAGDPLPSADTAGRGKADERREPRAAETSRSAASVREKLNESRRSRAADAEAAAGHFRRLQKRNNRRRTFTVSLIAIAAILLTLVLIRTLTSHAVPKPKLGIVQLGTVGDRYSAHGFIVRDEVVLNAPAAGRPEALVPEGQRVAVGTRIALILSDLDPANYEALRDLDRRIADRRLTVMNERSLAGAERIYIDSDALMHDTINAMRIAVRDGGLAEVANLQASLESIMQERNVYLEEIPFGDPILADLRSERRIYQNRITENASALTVDRAGLVSFRPDELAAELKPDMLEEIEFKDFKEYYARTDKRIRTFDTVEAGQAVASVLTGSAHYIALQIDGIKSTDIPEGAPIAVEFPEDALIIENCFLERMSPNEEGVMLILRTNRELEALLGKRGVEVSILLNSDRGLKVPGSSLVFKEEASAGMADLYLLSGGFVEVERVRVLMSDREYALIEPLQENTKISSGAIVIENPDSVKEGEAVG